MDATTQAPTHHHEHEMPTSGAALTSVAFSATLHCLTGCAIGEITGMVIGTALGFSDLATIALAVALAFLFGYTLTSLPLLRAGMALRAVVPIAFASDTLSIAVMEVVDNAIMVVVPGAMEAGVSSLLFWASLSVALVIAGAIALPVNRWLIARGKGHVAVHRTGIHGGPPTRLVAAIAAVAGVFGTVVLAAELLSGSPPARHRGGEHATEPSAPAGDRAAEVRGLSASADGLTLRMRDGQLPRGQTTQLRFVITGAGDAPVTDFQVEHEKRMHLILVRRDLTGFQHLHPRMVRDGTWSTPVTIDEPGRYRVFADFKRRGANHTLATDLLVSHPVAARPLPAPAARARTVGGYEVRIAGQNTARRESELRFTVTRGGHPVSVEPYLGAGGHLVALRQRDLAYLHVHPVGHGAVGGNRIAFVTAFPSAARYRLFLQFKDRGRVHTAAFTRVVGARSSPEPAGGQPAGGGHGH